MTNRTVESDLEALRQKVNRNDGATGCVVMFVVVVLGAMLIWIGRDIANLEKRIDQLERIQAHQTAGRKP